MCRIFPNARHFSLSTAFIQMRHNFAIVLQFFLICRIFQLRRIFPNAPHFSDFAAVFQVCRIFPIAPHFFQIGHFFLIAPNFSKCTTFFFNCAALFSNCFSQLRSIVLNATHFSDCLVGMERVKGKERGRGGCSGGCKKEAGLGLSNTTKKPFQTEAMSTAIFSQAYGQSY